MEKQEIDFTNLLQEINQAEDKCLETLKNLRHQRLELTKHDVIPFTVSTIHKDRRYIVIRLIEKIQDEKDFDELSNEWKKTAEATTNGWFGTLKASAEKAKLISILYKLAKEGCSVSVDASHKIDIPAPDKWWDSELHAEVLLERYKENKED